MSAQTAQKTGRIIEIKGVVIDAVFPEGLPEIYSSLSIAIPEREGQEERSLIAEVQQHLGDDRLRAVAMDSTDGLARGLEVRETGGPISVPVGEVTLGRVFDVLGRPIDNKGAVNAEQTLPIHRAPPAFDQQTTEVEVFETGDPGALARRFHGGVALVERAAEAIVRVRTGRLRLSIHEEDL